MSAARTVAKTSVAVALASFGVVACAASPDGPSKGSYTVQFPSTEAAVATDSVIVLVFDGPKGADDRATLCQQLVQATGGELKVETELGKGTRFSFVLDLPISPRVSGAW